MTAAAAEPAAAPAWAKGHPVPGIKEVSGFFQQFEKPVILGAFTRCGDLDVVGWLERKQLHGSASTGYMYVLAHVQKRQAVRDFGGNHRTDYQPGDLVVKRMAWADETAAVRMIASLAQYTGGRRVWFELWHELPQVRELVQRLGLAHVCTRVKSSSELLGVYVLGTTPVAPVDAAEAAGLVRLGTPTGPDVPQDGVAYHCAQLAALLGDDMGFAAHYSNYQRGSTWSALALRGYAPLDQALAPDPTFIAKPSEMNKRWRQENADKLDWRPRWTGLMTGDLGGHVQAILDYLPRELRHGAGPEGFDRVRLMRLAPGGGELTRHADITDKEAGVADNRLLRIHVPITTNPGVVFEQWLLDGRRQQGVHMGAGEVWYLDQRKPHTAVNGGAEPRVHLVADMYGSEPLRQLVRAGYAPVAQW